MDPSHYIAPVEASLDFAIKHVSCGEEHTALLTPDGKLFLMGSNACGQLGLKVKRSSNSIESFSTDEDGRGSNKYFEPIPVELPDPSLIIVKVACGEQHTLALTKQGLVYSWGEARYGALGIDFTQES